MKFLTLLFLLLLSAKAYCCNCAPPFPDLRRDGITRVSYAMIEYAYVFKGRLITHKDTVIITNEHSSLNECTEYTFEVLKDYKGNILTDTIRVYEDFSNCRYGFVYGENFLVHAYNMAALNKRRKRTKTTYPFTNKCTPTIVYNDKQAAHIEQLLLDYSNIKNK